MHIKRILPVGTLFLVLFFLVACASQSPLPTETPAPAQRTPIPFTATPDPEADTADPTATPLLADIIAARTPMPTATPGLLEQEITELVREAGLESSRVLGIELAIWINVGTSILIIFAGYLIGTILNKKILPSIVKRTATTLDDEILEASGRSLRRLLVLVALYFGTQQLRIIGLQVKTVLVDIYFILGLVLILQLTLRLIRVVESWYRRRSVELDQEEELASVITMLVRFGQVAAWSTWITVLLSHFGVNVSALAAALGLGGLAISLAARDTVADAIAGMIILFDRPFRLGDRIEIKAVNTWGDVVDIGLRTTRIRTRDNRLIIVPNSSIGANEVINYSYPDPNYRIQTHVGIAYGSDIEQVRQLIVNTVLEVEGVIKDKPVDALYVEMNDTAMIFRVRWWIETYVDTRRMFDSVHTALQMALDEAGIQTWAHVSQGIRLQVEEETAVQMSQAFWSQQDRRTLPDDSAPHDSASQ